MTATVASGFHAELGFPSPTAVCAVVSIETEGVLGWHATATDVRAHCDPRWPVSAWAMFHWEASVGVHFAFWGASVAIRRHGRHRPVRLRGWRTEDQGLCCCLQDETNIIRGALEMTTKGVQDRMTPIDVCHCVRAGGQRGGEDVGDVKGRGRVGGDAGGPGCVG